MVVERLEETLAASEPGARRRHEWTHHLMWLLTAAVGQIQDREHPAHRTLLTATSLLRQQIDPRIAGDIPNRNGRLLAWQLRKVRSYVDCHIAERITVADLSALIPLSGAHFSRAFRRTCKESPHAFVVRRRLELAAQYLLETDAPISDIALRCGFADQAHLCRLFRRARGISPASWRRACKAGDEESHLTALLSDHPYNKAHVA
jgi:AraC family transcriptional regulator